jgi:chromosome segregation ATPase
MSSAPPPLPTRRNAADDPFSEPPEPKPPRGGGPEEKLEYLREVVKLKSDTLQRARGLYARLASELERARASLADSEDRRKAAAAEAKAAAVDAKEAERERKELTRDLAAVENQLSSERDKRNRIDGSLVKLKAENAELERRLREQAALARKVPDDRAARAEMERKLAKEANARVVLEAELAGLRLAVDEAQAEADALREQALQAQEVADDRELELERQDGDLKELKHRLAVAEKERDGLARKLESSRKQCVELSEQLAELQSESDHTDVRTQFTEVTTLTVDISALQDELEELRQVLSNPTALRARLQKLETPRGRHR